MRWEVLQTELSLGSELASLLGDHDEEAEDLLLGELAVAVGVDLAEGLIELVLGELRALIAVLGVHVLGHTLDLFLLEETGAILIKGGENGIDELLDLFLGD